MQCSLRKANTLLGGISKTVMPYPEGTFATKQVQSQLTPPGLGTREEGNKNGTQMTCEKRLK